MKKIAIIVGVILVSVSLGFAQIQEKNIRITSDDRFVLSGRYYTPNQPGPGILLLHQCNRKGPLTGYEGLAPLLAEEGFHVLMLDSRGFGNSRDKQYRDYHTQMELIDTKVRQDVEAAYQFLISQKGVDKNIVGVAGASCGTPQAISLAKNHPEIRTLVFISGSYMGLEGVESDYETLTDRPSLAIYSEEDRYNTPESMQTAFAKSNHKSSKLIVYKGNVHGTPLFERDKDLEREIAIWFIAHLLTN